MRLLWGRHARRAVLLFSVQVCLWGFEATLAEKSERAKLWMAQGRFAAAATLYEELTQAVPGNPGLLLNLGMARHMAGQDAAAIAPLEASLRLQPSSPALLFLGASYLRTGQAAKAVAVLKRFAAAEPNHREVRRLLADACAATGNHVEATTHLRKLADWEPEQPGAWYALGRSYEEVAAAYFARLPEDSGYWMALAADALNKRSQTRAGFLLYRKAIESLPGQRGLHAAVADLYRRIGREDWAEEEMKQEAALGPPVCSPVPTPECDFAAGRFQEMLSSERATPGALYWKIRAADALSRKAFGRLMALPPSLHSHRFAAEAARSEGRHMEAVMHWRAALATSPGDPAIELEMADSLAAAKDFDAAQAIVTKLLAGDSETPELNFLQGNLLLNLQQPEKAIPFLAKAAERNPTFLPARASLGRALVLAGRSAEAAPHLEASLAADEDGGIHYQLARSYQATGKVDLAKRALASYQEIQRKLEDEKHMIEQASEITGPKKVR